MLNANERPKARRERVSARLDPEVVAVVERVAEAERRSVSSLVRNILSDWTAGVLSRSAEHAQQGGRSEGFDRQC
jgi:predicted transcriptional regulator